MWLTKRGVEVIGCQAISSDDFDFTVVLICSALLLVKLSSIANDFTELVSDEDVPCGNAASELVFTLNKKVAMKLD